MNWDMLGTFTPLIALASTVIVVGILIYLLRRPIKWIINKVQRVVNFIVLLVNKAKAALGFFLNIQTWMYPLIVLGICWLFEDLHVQGSLLDIPAGSEREVIIVGAIAFVLFCVQVAIAGNPKENLRGLITDLLASIFWVIGLSLYSGYQQALGQEELWTIIPTYLVYADIVVNGPLALRTAFLQTEFTGQNKG